MTPILPDARRAPPEASVPTGPHADLTGDLSIVVGSLHEQYDSRLGAAVVDTEIQLIADRFTTAKVRAFVPLFVRRYAGARFRDDCAAPPGPEVDPPPGPAVEAPPGR